MTLRELFGAIADSIRRKDGTTEKINPLTFPARIDAISGGSGKEVQILDRSITEYASEEKIWLGKHAFRECTNLLSVSLPNTTNVNMYAFSGCTSLEVVNLPKVTTVTGYAFENCTALKRLELPLCRVLAKYAMKGAGLVQVVISGGSVGSYAFQDCKNLETVDIVGSAWTINGYAFSGCEKLTALILRTFTGKWTMQSFSAFEGTPIENGKGYIYVPKEEIENLKMDPTWAEYYLDVTRAIEDWPEITGG